MSKSIQAIVFDAYGTLLNVNSLDEVLSQYFGESAAGELSALWRRKQLEYTWLRTLMVRYKPFIEVTMDALRHGCEALELTYTEAIEQQLQQEYLRLKAYPEVLSVLKPMTKYFELGVLSNANPQMLEGAIERNSLQEIFKHVLSADDIGMYKPRPEVYQLACDRFQLASEQILFVSSNTWDVSGAKSHGLQVAWLNRFNGTQEELGFEPDYMVNQLDQLNSRLSGGF